jgi:hypothetical protein
MTRSVLSRRAGIFVSSLLGASGYLSVLHKLCQVRATAGLQVAAALFALRRGASMLTGRLHCAPGSLDAQNGRSSTSRGTSLISRGFPALACL